MEMALCPRFTIFIVSVLIAYLSNIWKIFQISGLFIHLQELLVCSFIELLINGRQRGYLIYCSLKYQILISDSLSLKFSIFE